MDQLDKDKFYISIGEAIKIARTNIDMSQASLAEKINMSRASIVNIEKGRQSPPIHLLWQLSRLLKVSIIDFLPSSTSQINGEADFFKEKLQQNLSKGIINADSEKNINSFIREK